VANIKKKLIFTVLLLVLALAMCISTAAAASTTQKNTTSTYKAAGSPTTTVTVTISQLDKSAESVKAYIAKNKMIPDYVTISGKQVTMPQYLYLLSYGVTNLNSNKKSSVSVKIPINKAPKPSQTVKSGTLTKKEYVKVAGNLKKFVDTNKRLPNFLITSRGNMRYESMIDAYTRIIVFYGDNKRLPNTVAVAPWETYLQPTKDAPSTSATIKNLAATLTKGKTTTLAKATAIFNWVRDNITYTDPMYYNTKKGALGTLKARNATCCDTTHLLVALYRASGIPARYRHAYCYFYPRDADDIDGYDEGGWFGHVWAHVWVNGKWYDADAIRLKNTFGTIKIWNTKNYSNRGTYATLPF
jgi:transglutaminase-like putative cysteine protease